MLVIVERKPHIDVLPQGCMTASAPRVVRAKRSAFVFVCAKCVRKTEHGTSIRKALKAELKGQARLTGRRADKIVDTKCMGLCPKEAVAVTNGAMLIGRELLILKRPGDVPEAVSLLLGRAGVSAPPRAE